MIFDIDDTMTRLIKGRVDYVGNYKTERSQGDDYVRQFIDRLVISGEEITGIGVPDFYVSLLKKGDLVSIHYDTELSNILGVVNHIQNKEYFCEKAIKLNFIRRTPWLIFAMPLILAPFFVAIGLVWSNFINSIIMFSLASLLLMSCWFVFRSYLEKENYVRSIIRDQAGAEKASNGQAEEVIYIYKNNVPKIKWFLAFKSSNLAKAFASSLFLVFLVNGNEIASMISSAFLSNNKVTTQLKSEKNQQPKKELQSVKIQEYKPVATEGVSKTDNAPKASFANENSATGTLNNGQVTKLSSETKENRQPTSDNLQSSSLKTGDSISQNMEVGLTAKDKNATTVTLNSDQTTKSNSNILGDNRKSEPDFLQSTSSKKENSNSLSIESNPKASFDCKKASTNVEILICSDPILAKNDFEFSSHYKIIYESAKDKARLKKEQIEWIRLIRDKCLDIECIRIAYRERKNYISAQSY